MSMDINFIFIRHGYSCGNYTNSLTKKIDLDEKYQHIIDPELTGNGVYYSCKNSNTINNILADKYNIDTINIIGCSPLLRSMETAYYMSRQWKNPPNTIYVLPYLREIDEQSLNDDIYSSKSIENMNKRSSYKMKEIDEQKEFLKKKGILDVFDFDIVKKYKKERKDPGDINKFMNWFSKILEPNVTKLKHDKIINVFIITHSGVLNYYAKNKNINDTFYNNTGFIVKYNKYKEPIYKSINKYLDFNEQSINSKYYFDISYTGKQDVCENDRCNNIYKYIEYIKK